MLFVNILKDAAQLFATNWKTILLEYTVKTLLLAAIAVVIGTVIGSFLAFAHMSKIKPLKWFVVAIVVKLSVTLSPTVFKYWAKSDKFLSV